MDQQRFDDFTRVLATGTSRSQVLKGLVACTLGGLLAPVLGGRAWASTPNCPDFCNRVFGKDTAATTQCIQDAKKGTGLCASCGPASAGGGIAAGAVCCTRTSSGYCASYSGTTCPCAGAGCPGCGSVKLSNGTCAKPATSPADCTSGLLAPGKSGGFFCSSLDTIAPCFSDSQCPTGYFCSVASCLVATC